MSSPSNTIIRGSSSLTSTHDKYLSESLKKIVDHYKEEMRPLARKELQLFARQPDLISAVYAAAMSEYPPGKRHSHQRRTSRHVLNDTYETLKHIDYSEFRNFHSLHSALQVIIGSTKGIGPLAVYDIAQRIGSYLGLEPERIYLHAATKEGARALELGYRKPFLGMSDLPKEFRELKPYEIKDCLAIYKDKLKKAMDERQEKIPQFEDSEVFFHEYREGDSLTGVIEWADPQFGFRVRFPSGDIGLVRRDSLDENTINAFRSGADIRKLFRDGDEIYVQISHINREEKVAFLNLKGLNGMLVTEARYIDFLLSRYPQENACMSYDASSETRQYEIKDQVKFSSYSPSKAQVNVRHAIIVYAHLKDEMRAIEKDIQKFRNELGGKISAPKVAKNKAQIEYDTPITVIVECEELEFNPPQLTKNWKGKYVRFRFAFTPNKELFGETLFVRVSIQIGHFEIAHIKFAIDVIEKQAQEFSIKDKLKRDTSDLYKKIFVSYSLKDQEVFDDYRSTMLAIGDDIFQDTYSVRREEWTPAKIVSAICKSDIFHLFWSPNSAKSPSVRDDLNYALKYKCPEDRCVSFIRPVYWKKPLRPAPLEEISHLTFSYEPFKISNGVVQILKTSVLKEFEVIEKHVEYLDRYFKGLSQELIWAREYIETDAKGSLWKSRLVCEKIMKNVYKDEMLCNPPKHMTFSEMMNELRFKKRLKPEMFILINRIKDMGNLGTHGEDVTPKQAHRIVIDLLAVLAWHSNTYR